MSKKQEPPVAVVRVETNKFVRSLIVDKCPLCGRRHVHGGGRADDPKPVEQFLGHRGAHCTTISLVQ